MTNTEDSVIIIDTQSLERLMALANSLKLDLYGKERIHLLHLAGRKHILCCKYISAYFANFQVNQWAHRLNEIKDSRILHRKGV